jgi:hypothetical protein
MIEFFRHLVICLALGAAVITGSTATVRAQASTTYDGLWTVLIVTQNGPCDASYRYPVRISRGNVRHVGGEAFFSLKGRVNPRGSVNVTLSRDGQQARGTGRLSGKSGGGSWSAGGGTCSGRWSALRRG